MKKGMSIIILILILCVMAMSLLVYGYYSSKKDDSYLESKDNYDSIVSQNSLAGVVSRNDTAGSKHIADGDISPDNEDIPIMLSITDIGVNESHQWEIRFEVTNMSNYDIEAYIDKGYTKDKSGVDISASFGGYKTIRSGTTDNSKLLILSDDYKGVKEIGFDIMFVSKDENYTCKNIVIDTDTSEVKDNVRWSKSSK